MKFIFELEGDSDWPPVNAESLWFDEHECGFQLKSIPFFVPNLAYDDVVDLVDQVEMLLSNFVFAVRLWPWDLDEFWQCFTKQERISL